MNPYVGCLHACKYCYASFMKRFTNHPEPWGTFLDVKAIIERAKHQCNLVWLENLNLRGDYRPVIMDWIHENHPELDELYNRIYSQKDCRLDGLTFFSTMARADVMLSRVGDPDRRPAVVLVILDSEMVLVNVFGDGGLADFFAKDMV